MKPLSLKIRSYDMARGLKVVRTSVSPRRTLVKAFVTIAVALVIGVLVLRVLLPALIDAHSDVALFAAVAVGIASIAAALWFGWGLFVALRRAFRR